MDKKETGIEKIKRLSDEVVENEESDSEKEVVIEFDIPLEVRLPGEETTYDKDEIYDKMIEEFGEFIEHHRFVKALRLRLEKTKPNHYVIYQGSRSSIFATLKPHRCYFYRTSLLRTIKSLPDDSFLKEYFKNYSLVGGADVRIL